MDPLEYEFTNNVAGLTFYMKLEDDIDEACKVNLKESKKIKNSLIPWGTYVYLWFMVTVSPTAYFLYSTKNAAAARAKFSFLLTNIPGLMKRTTYFGGNVVTRLSALTTNPGNGATVAMVVSTHNAAQLCLTSDPSMVKDIQKWKWIFNNELKNMDLEYKKSEEGSD